MPGPRTKSAPDTTCPSRTDGAPTPGNGCSASERGARRNVRAGTRPPDGLACEGR
jgi:hypothetical protein